MFATPTALLTLVVRWLAIALWWGLVPTCAASASAVDVVIDMRAEIAAARFDPQRDGVGVRGARAPLSWSASAMASDSSGSGLYRVRLHFDDADGAGQPVAYKFKVERPGRPEFGWESGRNRALVLAPGAQQLERAFGSDPGAPPPQRAGRIDRLAPQPSAWVQAREVQVWLPPGYADAGLRRYPVLYLHDGQNVFDAVAAGAEWQVDETALRLVSRGEVEPMIIVAVASTDERTLDYTPVPHVLPGQGRVGGGAARYGRYLVEELKPLIDARYRTLPGRASTAVGGSSFGGLVSMWLLLEQADTFGSGLLVSPSVWWGDAVILDQVARKRLPVVAPPRIWLDMGTGEGDAALQGARRLHDALRQRGWPVAYLEQPGAGHDEAAWAERAEPMLRFLYGAAGR